MIKSHYFQGKETRTIPIFSETQYHCHQAQEAHNNYQTTNRLDFFGCFTFIYIYIYIYASFLECIEYNEERFWLNAEETEAYWKLVKVFRTPTEIMEVFKGLIYTKDSVQPLIDGSTKKPVCTKLQTDLKVFYTHFFLYLAGKRKKKTKNFLFLLNK